jgi:hypothetical protein
MKIQNQPLFLPLENVYNKPVMSTDLLTPDTQAPETTGTDQPTETPVKVVKDKKTAKFYVDLITKPITNDIQSALDEMVVCRDGIKFLDDAIQKANDEIKRYEDAKPLLLARAGQLAKVVVTGEPVDMVTTENTDQPSDTPTDSDNTETTESTKNKRNRQL